ncbi:MAG TPA: precorrin-3B C(17)-methyltransferase [Acidimicrobiales bacterium]|nr:precorrin-3B C(17)-methyltransferase [Acidimicrobiales bacterium]
MRVLSISVTERGRLLAARLPWEHAHGGAAGTIRQRWSDVDGLVLFLATGAAVRIIAPLLADKRTDPAVVCVDDAGQFAVSLCGGHAAGGNDLARRVASCLNAEPVITTATDAVGMTAIDQLPGFTVSGDVAAVTAALLDGRPVAIDNPRRWPLPLAASASAAATRIVVTDEVIAPGPGTAVLHPPSLVAGIGTSTDALVQEVDALLAAAVAEAGLARASLTELATIDRRGGAPAIVSLGLPLRTFSADELAAVKVPTPSDVVKAAVGTPSVCEAAALLAAGAGGELVVTKRSSASATVAIARRAGPRGRLVLVGLGPGGPEHRTPAAERAVRESDVVIGYRAYLDQCADLIRPAQEAIGSPIGDEVVRAKQALAEAATGRRVALVCSGDAGVYGMASITFELTDGTIDVDVVPGVPAAVAAAALLGAPLGHDHAAISLSDLLTPWAVIERRLRAAAEADLVVSLYNPRSHGRDWQLDTARRIFLEHRPPATPVGVVTDAGRVGQRVSVTSLADLDSHTVGMTTCVVIGATSTRVVAGRMVTPRGFARSW